MIWIQIKDFKYTSSTTALGRGRAQSAALHNDQTIEHMGHTWTAGGTQVADSVRTQIQLNKCTNTRIQIQKYKYTGSTWVTLGLWQKPAGGRQVAAAVCCRLFCHQQPLRHPPNLSYAVGPMGPKIQKILNTWSKKIRLGPKYQKTLPKIQLQSASQLFHHQNRHPPNQSPSISQMRPSSKINHSPDFSIQNLAKYDQAGGEWYIMKNCTRGKFGRTG